MTVAVACPGCGLKLKAPDNMIGKKAKCKKCRTSFRVPGPAGAEPETDVESESQFLSVMSVPGLPPEPVGSTQPPPESEDPPLALPVETTPEAASLPSADPFDFTAPPAKSSLAAASSKPPEAPTAAPPMQPRPAAESPRRSPSAPPAAGSSPTRPAVGGSSSKSAPAKPAATAAPGKSASPPPSPPQEILAPNDAELAASEPETSVQASDNPFEFGMAAPPPEPSKSKVKKSKVGETPTPATKSRAKAAPILDKLEPEAEATAPDDPFSFGGAEPVAVPQQAGAEADADDAPASRSAEEGGARPGARRYGRRGEKKSNKLLMIAASLVLVTLGAAMAAVAMHFSKKDQDVAKNAPEQKEEAPPASVPAAAAATTEEPKAGKKDSFGGDARKNSAKRDARTPRPPGEVSTAVGGPAATLTLPANLKNYSFRASNVKQELIDRPKEAPIQVDAAFESVKRIFPSEDRIKKDIVVVWQSNPGAGGAGEQLSADLYSGTTGGRVGRIDFAGDGKDVKCDVSPDGKLFLAAVNGKVSVWNLADKDRAKLVEGFDPYAEKPAHQKAGLAAVYATSNSNNFLTVSTAGAIHLFDIAGKKELAEYVPEKGTPGKVVQGKSVCVDETGSSVAVVAGGAIHQVKTLDLTLSWKLQLGEVGRSFGVSVQGLPGRIAYAFETEGEKKDRAILFCLPNQQTPNIFRWQDSAGEPVNVNWAGSDFIVVGTTGGVVWFEYNSEIKVFTPLALAKIPGDKSRHETTDRSQFYLIPNPADAKKSLLLEIVTPIPGAMDVNSEAASKKPLDTLRLDDKGLWR